ncbi:MAG: sulfatase-like hydrolase/transferase [Verrucomicrobiales bacterium]
MKKILLTLGTLSLLVIFGARGAAPEENTAPKPNLILFWCDNLGYGDIGPFGSTLHRTPNLDRMANEGMKLTHFYSTSGVCTPSRASLMTSSYPRRVNMQKNPRGGSVIQPVESIGLHPEETTIAEVLQGAGYTTMLIGKWHLGDQLAFLPTRQGFDHYWGIPYSDDMTPREGQVWPPLPLLRDERVIEAPVDRREMTRRETEEAIAFLEENRDEPFFLMMSHTMPGSTRAPFASEAFRGKSENGPWGDAVEELDWSAGRILETLKELDLDENTLVIWTSDNGAPRREPPQGSNLPLGGWGYTTAEGGMRIPTIARWPGWIPAGSVCDQLATTMDLMPTFAALAGAETPADRVLDGKDIGPLLRAEEGARSPHEAFFYYHGNELQAVRSGVWKLFLPRTRDRRGRTEEIPARLYDVHSDPGETTDRIAEEPEVVERLARHAERARADLGDAGRHGEGQRAAGWVTDPLPLIQEGTEWAEYRPVPDEVFESLFDGKTLSGWKEHDGMPEAHRGGRWWVEDGELRGMQDPPGDGGLLWLDRDFRDFILRLQVKLDYPMDSGVFVRVGPDGRSHQITLDHRPGSSVGGIYVPFGGGTVHQSPEGAKALREDRWNDLEIQVEGEPAHIRVWINGRLVTDFQHTEETSEGCPESGGIGLQVHPDVEGMTLWGENHVVRFRNLRIRELDANEVPGAP